jgi:hypothetical protein
LEEEVSERPNSCNPLFPTRSMRKAVLLSMPQLFALTPMLHKGSQFCANQTFVEWLWNYLNIAQKLRMTLTVANGIERGKVSDTDDMRSAACSLTCRPTLRFTWQLVIIEFVTWHSGLNFRSVCSYVINEC